VGEELEPAAGGERIAGRGDDLDVVLVIVCQSVGCGEDFGRAHDVEGLDARESDDHDSAHDRILQSQSVGSKDNKETDSAMNEIVPGVFFWKEKHPKIGAEVSSYYLLDERVLIDPMQPGDGFDWFREHGEPEHILLSNRHHYRDSGKFVEAFGCKVHASRPGMHEFSDDQPVEPFDFDEELPGGVRA
jgi:hypothetical protein